MLLYEATAAAKWNEGNVYFNRAKGRNWRLSLFCDHHVLVPTSSYIYILMAVYRNDIVSLMMGFPYILNVFGTTFVITKNADDFRNLKRLDFTF